MSDKISIIIIDKNDRGIENTLNSLMTQKKPEVSVEILVIDASESDVLADIKIKHPEVTWYQFVPKIKNKSSIPEQRNFGIRKASGSIIVFIDANCVPVDGWLEKLTEHILSEEEDIVSGSFDNLDLSKRVIKENSNSYEYVTCSGTGNLAFRKTVWQKVQGFDENFLYGSDVDFTWRCIDAGFRIRSIPDARVSHDWGSRSEDLKRSFKYGKAKADLLMKHPRRILKQLLGESILVSIYTIWLVGLISTCFFIFYPLTIIIFLIKNIRNKPIKTVSMNLVYTIGFNFRILQRLRK